MKERMGDPSRGVLSPQERERRIQDVVWGTIGQYSEKFFGNSGDVRIERVYSVPMIRDTRSNWLDLAPGMTVVTVEAVKNRASSNHWYRTSQMFFVWKNDVIPLNTHALEGKNRLPFFELSQDATSLKEKQGVAEYLVQNLPNEVTLTRVMSAEEAKKYETGEGLGSNGNAFWEKGVIHTALHNVSTEFAPSEEYSRVAKFIIPKDQIARLVEQDVVEIGTYAWLFVARDPQSPFPFEAEVVIKAPGIAVLVEGFHRWRARGGRIEDFELS